MIDSTYGLPTQSENDEPHPRKKDMPWIKDPEDFRYKWYVDTEDECAACGYNDSPCVLFGEGDFFCSEECMRIFEEGQEKWEKQQEEYLRQEEEECAPWIEIDDVVNPDDDYL